MGRLKRLVLGIVVACLLIGGVEMLLRVTLPRVRTATLPDTMIRAHLDSPAFRYDPDLYWYWAHLPSPGVQINRYGFRRTKAMTVEKPPGVVRVVTFGDSQTLGAGVGPEESYSAVAERALGEGWEVLNAGISGYRSLNVYRLIQRRIAAFDPDVLVIDNMPFDSERDDGDLVRKPVGGVGTQVRAILWESRLYHLLRLGLEKLRPERERWLDRPAEAAGRGSEGLGNHDLIAAWGREHGVQVVFVQYPVSDEAWHHACMTRPNELPPGVPVVPACDVLRDSGRSARELFQDRNHLTVAGNELFGAALAETLRALLR